MSEAKETTADGSPMIPTWHHAAAAASYKSVEFTPSRVAFFFF